MNAEQLHRHRLGNALQTLLLLAGMVGILALVGYLLGGSGFVLWTVAAGLALLAVTPRLSPDLMLRLYRARPLSPSEVPELYAMAEELSRRAELPGTPRLYYVPSPVLNAFTVGRREAASVTLTDGLLRHLTLGNWRACWPTKSATSATTICG